MIITADTTISFGKYKGKLGRDIISDYNYFIWLKKETNHIFDDDMTTAFKEEFDKKSSNNKIFNTHCDSTYDRSYYGEL